MNRFQVRRATLEDLPQLRALWEVEGLPAAELEKRCTEFQVVENGDKQVLAALGLATLEGHGRLHSEAIMFGDEAENMRAQLWPRVKASATNLGLARLWTSLEAPFWKGVGFQKVNEETLTKIPADWFTEHATWLTLPLRVEAGSDDIEKQFAVLRAISQAENEHLLERAKMMKMVALGLMTVVFVGFGAWVIYWMKIRSRIKKRQTD